MKKTNCVATAWQHVGTLAGCEFFSPRPRSSAKAEEASVESSQAAEERQRQQRAGQAGAWHETCWSTWKSWTNLSQRQSLDTPMWKEFNKRVPRRKVTWQSLYADSRVPPPEGLENARSLLAPMPERGYLWGISDFGGMYRTPTCWRRRPECRRSYDMEALFPKDMIPYWTGNSQGDNSCE